jgi:hypothetical protein
MREWIYDHVMLLASPVEVTTMKIKVILMHELPRAKTVQQNLTLAVQTLPKTLELYGRHTNPDNRSSSGLLSIFLYHFTWDNTSNDQVPKS